MVRFLCWAVPNTKNATRRVLCVSVRPILVAERDALANADRAFVLHRILISDRAGTNLFKIQSIGH